MYIASQLQLASSIGMLYPASSDKTSMFEELAASLGAQKQITGEQIFKSLGLIGRLVVNNLGVTKHGRRNQSFAMYTGADVKQALSDAEKVGSRRSNIADTVGIIRQQFAGYEELIDDGNDHWSWLKSDGSNTVLGRLMLGSSELVFETNSVERGKQAEAFVQSLANDGLIGKPLTVHENLNDLISSGASAPTSPSSLSSDELQQLPEVQALLQKTMKDHYLKTLDEPIPMLDNDSPRDCAADPDKQSKVIVWLKSLENMEAKAPGPAQDFRWLWDELGLTAYR